MGIQGNVWTYFPWVLRRVCQIAPLPTTDCYLQYWLSYVQIEEWKNVTMNKLHLNHVFQIRLVARRMVCSVQGVLYVTGKHIYTFPYKQSHDMKFLKRVLVFSYKRGVFSDSFSNQKTLSRPNPEEWRLKNTNYIII